MFLAIKAILLKALITLTIDIMKEKSWNFQKIKFGSIRHHQVAIHGAAKFILWYIIEIELQYIMVFA